MNPSCNGAFVRFFMARTVMLQQWSSQNETCLAFLVGKMCLKPDPNQLLLRTYSLPKYLSLFSYRHLLNNALSVAFEPAQFNLSFILNYLVLLVLQRYQFYREQTYLAANHYAKKLFRAPHHNLQRATPPRNSHQRKSIDFKLKVVPPKSLSTLLGGDIFVFVGKQLRQIKKVK